MLFFKTKKEKSNELSSSGNELPDESKKENLIGKSIRLTDELRNERTRSRRGNTVFVKYCNLKFYLTRAREPSLENRCFRFLLYFLFFVFGN